MLKEHNLVYFAPEKWNGLWRNRQQLMSVFARQNKVLFVEPRPYFRPTLAGVRRGDIGLSDLRHPLLRPISNGLFVLSYPVWAPISGRLPLSQITKTVRQRFIRQVLRELQMSQPIVWLSRPDMVDLLDEIPPARLLLYHVVDEYTSYSGQTSDSRQRIAEREKQMMAQVDAVIVVSKELYQAKRSLNANTFLVPNGVNYGAYTAALADPHLPADLKVIPPPRLGYSGLVGDRLDLNMLKEMARENPEWSLIFLGEVRFSQQAESWQKLLAMPNVHYLGLADISQVPHYLKGFHVGLMPYIQDCHADNISPLKLYDYLAAGLPIASTDIPAAREFGSYVHLADNPQGFAQAVRTALSDTTPESRQVRRNVAAQHTWEARAEQLSDLIETRLITKVLK